MGNCMLVPKFGILRSNKTANMNIKKQSLKMKVIVGHL